MTTKTEERNALESIEKILESIDPDGYVNTAFAGCVDDARENIANDFALSWYDRANSYRNNVVDLENDLARYSDKIAVLEAGNDLMRDTIATLRNRVSSLESDCHGTFAALEEERAARAGAEETLKRLEAENLKLKARLFDMLYA